MLEIDIHLHTFIFRSKCSRACSNSHTVFSFFLASYKHAVATERANKSSFLSALMILAFHLHTFIFRSKCSRACSNSHTVFSFFLASYKHAVATERANKSSFLSALMILASTCFLGKSMDSCSFAFFNFTTSISCNLVLRFNEISAFFFSELIFSRSLLYLCEANKQL